MNLQNVKTTVVYCLSQVPLISCAAGSSMINPSLSVL